MLALFQRTLAFKAGPCLRDIARSFYIQTLDTPNPLTLKFHLPQPLIEEDNVTYEFRNFASTHNSPLAKSLIKIDGVKSVFFGKDFITITKANEEQNWADIRPHILKTISDFFMFNKPIFSGKNEPVGHDSSEGEDSEIVAMIKELLELRVRPMVQEDGGDIVFVGFDNGVVKLKLKGSCTGCPSSAGTLKGGVENMLKFYVPEVTEVVEVKDDEDEMHERAVKAMEKKLGIED